MAIDLSSMQRQQQGQAAGLPAPNRPNLAGTQAAFAAQQGARPAAPAAPPGMAGTQAAFQAAGSPAASSLGAASPGAVTEALRAPPAPNLAAGQAAFNAAATPAAPRVLGAPGMGQPQAMPKAAPMGSPSPMGGKNSPAPRGFGSARQAVRPGALGKNGGTPPNRYNAAALRRPRDLR